MAGPPSPFSTPMLPVLGRTFHVLIRRTFHVLTTCHHFLLDLLCLLRYTRLGWLSVDRAIAIRAARGQSLSNSRSFCRSTLSAVNPFSFCRSKITSDLFIPQQLKIARFQGFARLPGLTPFVCTDP